MFSKVNTFTFSFRIAISVSRSAMIRFNLSVSSFIFLQKIPLSFGGEGLGEG
jgi:hypothetical protein